MTVDIIVIHADGTQEIIQGDAPMINTSCPETESEKN